LIDLHTHTTESDGRFPPSELVSRAKAAGVTVLAITDHDTVAGCEAGAAECAGNGISFVPGIEMTAVEDGGDVHVLGYFLDVGSPGLHTFLSEQRRRRVERVREIVARLALLGMKLDADRILHPAVEDPKKAAGRPWVARALVAAGHAATVDEAFDRWLGRGRPAFVPRLGAAASEVISRIHGAGGIASIAHPVLLARDEWIPGLVSAGLDAIEAYHSDHDAEATSRYLAMASALNVAVSGGSDFHGDAAHGPRQPGAVSLPAEAYAGLLGAYRRRAATRATPSGASTSS
jgi:predicted metal-dependent phosphoesterase TrpH